MEQLPERVSSRGGAGPQRDGAQPDEADSNEPRQSGSDQSTGVKPEKENYELQARSRERVEEGPSRSIHRDHNIVSLHHNEPYVEPSEELLRLGMQAAERQAYGQHLDLTAPHAPNPEAGDVLAANYPSAVQYSDELTLATGDEVGMFKTDNGFGDVWSLGNIPLTGDSGIFPETYGISSYPWYLYERDSTTDSQSPAAVFGQQDMRRPGRIGSRSKQMPRKLTTKEEASFQCNVEGCSKVFSRSYNFKAHMETHDEKREYHFPCEVDTCTKKFVRKTDLQRHHQSVHAKGRNHKCDYCGRMFARIDTLRRHMNDACSKRFDLATLNLSLPDPPGAAQSPSFSSLSCGYNNDDDNDDGVVAIEKPALPASAYVESDGEAGSSVEHADSNAAMFSEESREQPTDPSSWLDFSRAEQAGMRGHPVDTTFSGTKEELDMDWEMEECSRSISSVAESIGSAVSGGGPLGQAGVNYVVAKFTQSDPELLALYTEASKRLSKDRFVDNNRRLLKMLYLDFAREEQTPSQKEAVAFFRSRRRRAEISLDILATVTPDYDPTSSAEDHRKEYGMLNAYFESLDAADAERVFEDEQDELDSDRSDVEDGEDQPSLDMTSLQAIGEYFVTSQAFSQYKQRLHQFLHPNHGKEHDTPAVEETHSGQEKHLMDVSRAYEPGAKTSTNMDPEHSFESQNQGMKDHDEQRLTTQSADEKSLRLEDAQQSLASSSQIQGYHMPRERDSVATWVAKWLTDTLWPPSNGSQRIWYLCGCGQHTYIDVKELERGGMESEWRSISESSVAARRAHSPQSSATPGSQLPVTPAPVHLGQTSSRNTASSNLPSQGTSNASQRNPNSASAISPGPSGVTQRDPMFLLICINGKAYKTLAELRCLDINDSYNDELLIRGILNQYEQARKGCQWTIDLLLPQWMLPAGLLKHFKFIWEAVPLSVRRPSFLRQSLLGQSISEWWSKCAPDISPWAPLHIIDTADFVEFELVPHPEGKEAFPSHFTSGCWPAPDNKQYRYRPVPMKCVKTMNLWHMRRPGPHTEVYWYNTVPKKVDGALYRPSGTAEDVVGYGVRINERLNDVFVLWWSLIFILATGVFIYVYSKCTSDNSSAFGMGAYLVAAFTVYIQLQYALWKRT